MPLCRYFLLACLLAGGCANTLHADPGDETNDQVGPSVETAKIGFFVELKTELKKTWPHNRTVRVVFHGHSVPAGYARTPTVRTFDAYPSLFHHRISKRFPTAVIDVCVTAIGGENSIQGAKRFASDVLSLRPDLVFIDYSLNDRGVGLAEADSAWRSMIRDAAKAHVQVVLLTPTPDANEDILDESAPLAIHAAQVRQLGIEFGVPVVDSFAAFAKLVEDGKDVNDFLAQANHPNRAGHQVIASEILELFH